MVMPTPALKGFSYGKFYRLMENQASKEAVYEYQRFPAEIRNDGDIWIYKYFWESSVSGFASPVRGLSSESSNYSTAAAVLTFNPEGRLQKIEFLRGNGAGAKGCTPSQICIQDTSGTRIHEFTTTGSQEDKNWVLAYAARKGDLAEIKHQLQKGEDVNEMDDRGRTPLQYAVNSRNAAATRLLLENGANPDIKDSRTGETPLHWAVRSGDLEITRLLAPRMKHINAVDKEDVTAADIAALLKRTSDVVGVLNRYGAKKNRMRLH